ncbi:cyclophilin peptidyl-prolyl cis-trans isomerase Cyp2 [Ascochyta clinopodiicola]|nr:cyclophilin peptidyl-prolyl cis-trans isomerase Cyp2 [Ascochyta clinopodiicola]
MDKLKKIFKHDSSSSHSEPAAASHTQGTTAPTTTTSAQAPQSNTPAGHSSAKASGVLMTTNYGDITIALYSDKTPKTCENFAGLADAGKYDGVIFHRVIPGFMLQGGDPTGTGRGGESIWGGKFADEFDNSLLHTGPGVLSMANSGPGTNGSQFFVTLAATPHLNGKHTVFGQVVDGLDVVQKIGNVRTDGGDRPLEEVVIVKAQSIAA